MGGNKELDTAPLTHDDLITLGRKWLLKSFESPEPHGHTACPVIITELATTTLTGEIPDILAFNSYTSILIECKISRSDFIADLKKPFRMVDTAIGSQRWYLAPQGVIPLNKLPPKWGLLEVTPKRKIIITQYCQLQPRHFLIEIDILLSTLRRLNIALDNHVAIRQYTNDVYKTPSKKKATFCILPE